jgi:hypothetical protein
LIVARRNKVQSNGKVYYVVNGVVIFENHQEAVALKRETKNTR